MGLPRGVEEREMNSFLCSDLPLPEVSAPDGDLRGYFETNSDIVTRVRKQVALEDIGALSAQSENPILFENIAGLPGFRVCDMLVRNRKSQARAIGAPEAQFLRTLAYRLRQPARGVVQVKCGPVKEVKWLGKDASFARLPIPFHKEDDRYPYLSAMILLRDPETGFYNTSHAGTTIVEPQLGLSSFVTSHSLRIMKKYREMGADRMPMAFAVGVPPAYEIMGNFSGLHMDSWGEVDMFGTVMGREIEMTPCETIELEVPARAEMVLEGYVSLSCTGRTGDVTSPSMYCLPHYEDVPRFHLTGVTMRADRPIYRNHQTCPDTDHQILPRLCHEAVLFNRLVEMGLDVRDVRFPSWGGALSCLLQFEYPREGMVNDALMMAMGAPWINTKLVVALSPDTDVENAADVYHAIATRVDPSRDLFVVGNTRGSLYDPSATPIPDDYPFRVSGKIGIDATIKKRHNAADFQRAWPMNWGKVFLKDYLAN
jgi:2,5-furandicarboxylate decarboxylase 1